MLSPSSAGPYRSDIPMQPRPSADTVGPPVPSVRVVISHPPRSPAATMADALTDFSLCQGGRLGRAPHCGTGGTAVRGPPIRSIGDRPRLLAQPAPARGGAHRGRPAAGPGGRRERQDAGAHAPDRAPGRRPPGRPARRILAITFTNKAAGEMRERLAGLVGPASRALWASTFHSACVRILRREAHEVGYERDFTIFDQADQLRVICGPATRSCRSTPSASRPRPCWAGSPTPRTGC